MLSGLISKLTSESILGFVPFFIKTINISFFDKYFTDMNSIKSTVIYMKVYRKRHINHIMETISNQSSNSELNSNGGLTNNDREVIRTSNLSRQIRNFKRNFQSSI